MAEARKQTRKEMQSEMAEMKGEGGGRQEGGLR